MALTKQHRRYAIQPAALAFPRGSRAHGDGVPLQAGIAGIRGEGTSDLFRAETGHASVRLLAVSLLTIGSKRNSAALSRGFRSVAGPAMIQRLLHLRFVGLDEKPRGAVAVPASWLSLRETGASGQRRGGRSCARISA